MFSFIIGRYMYRWKMATGHVLDYMLAGIARNTTCKPSSCDSQPLVHKRKAFKVDRVALARGGGGFSTRVNDHFVHFHDHYDCPSHLHHLVVSPRVKVEKIIINAPASLSVLLSHPPRLLSSSHH